MTAKQHKKKLIRFIEFFVIGVLVGVCEDLLVVAFATEASIDLHVILIALVIAIPFAYLSEFVVDHPRFWEYFLPSHWFEGDK